MQGDGAPRSFLDSVGPPSVGEQTEDAQSQPRDEDEEDVDSNQHQTQRNETTDDDEVPSWRQPWIPDHLGELRVVHDADGTEVPTPRNVDSAPDTGLRAGLLPPDLGQGAT